MGTGHIFVTPGEEYRCRQIPCIPKVHFAWILPAFLQFSGMLIARLADVGLALISKASFEAIEGP